MMNYDGIDAYESSIPSETRLIAEHRAEFVDARAVITMSPKRYAKWRKGMLECAAECDWPDWALDEIGEIQGVETADACREYIDEGKTADEAMALVSRSGLDNIYL